MRLVKSLLGALSFATSIYANGFDLNELPLGKSVTLPTPAKTKIPVESRVRLTATDHQQTLKLTSQGNGKWTNIKVAIYDQNSEKVRYVNLAPGASIVYNFKDLRPIQIIPTRFKNKRTGNVWLSVESNRPLTIGR